jgi:hypothetical protein
MDSRTGLPGDCGTAGDPANPRSDRKVLAPILKFGSNLGLCNESKIQLVNHTMESMLVSLFWVNFVTVGQKMRNFLENQSYDYFVRQLPCFETKSPIFATKIFSKL